MFSAAAAPDDAVVCCCCCCCEECCPLFGGEAGPPPPTDVCAGAVVVEAVASKSWSSTLERWGLPEPDMMVLDVVPVSLFVLLLLFSAVDTVLDDGGAFPPGSDGDWDVAVAVVVAVAAFNPEEALLLVVGAADIDAIRNYKWIRLCFCDYSDTGRVLYRTRNTHYPFLL